MKQKYTVTIEDGGTEYFRFPTSDELKSMIFSGAYEGSGSYVSRDCIEVENEHPRTGYPAKCPECKKEFFYNDSKIIDDIYVLCPDCGNKLCILE